MIHKYTDNTLETLMSFREFKVLKFGRYLGIFILSSLVFVAYQNCGQTGETGLFNSQCIGEHCYSNPDELSLKLDLNLVPGGVFKISTNPPTGYNNLRLTGSCSDGGFTRTLVKAKIYQCIGSTNCSILKHIKATSCGPDKKFEISSTIGNLTPGNHLLELEIVGLDEFNQEVYGRNSQADAIPTQAKQTIRAPVLASFSGANYWATDKVYPFVSSSEKIVLDGYMTGFCDFNATVPSANAISIKLGIKGSSTYTVVATSTCQSIVAGSVQANSPNRDGRSGYFTLDAFSIFMIYNGGSFVTCESTDYNCINNPFNRMTNRLVFLGLSQKDMSFDYDVMSNRKLALQYTASHAGKGWSADILLETLRRIKKSFNFSNSDVSGALDGTQSGTNDFTQAYRVITSSSEYVDPLVSSGDNRYGFGTRSFIVRWLLGATEDISQSLYTNNDIYFMGSQHTIPFRTIAQGSGCAINASVADPIKGVVGAQYSTDVGVERIAVCLAHRFYNGFWDKPYSETVKMVQQGVTFANNNQNCFYNDGNPIATNTCTELIGFLQAATQMKNRHLSGAQFNTASESQMTYFTNGLSQYYIHRVMTNLAYRNASGENEFFGQIFTSVYPEITDAAMRRSLYPKEYNFAGSTLSFGATRTKQHPIGSYTH